MSNFVPAAEHIRDKVYCGTFYQRPAASPAINVAEISRVCYDMRGERCPGLTAGRTADVVWRIANSPWNRAHFQYAMTGVQNYTNYGYEGPQYGKAGGVFPLLWIPGPNAEEPEQMFGSQGPPLLQLGPLTPPSPTPGQRSAAPGTRTGSGSRSSGGTGEGSRSSGGGDGNGGSGGTSKAGVGTFAAFVGQDGGFPWWILLLVAGGGAVWWVSKKGKKGGGKRRKR